MEHRDWVVRTVLADIPVGEVGATMCHEHLKIDLTNEFIESTDVKARELPYSPLSTDNLALIHLDPALNRENLIVADEGVLAEELGRYRDAGGSTIVDCTVPGIGRDPAGLARLSAATGVHIVMGAGYYIARTHPASVARMTIDQLALDLVTDIRSGDRATGIRAGIIGEIASSWPMDSSEERVFRGAGRAQAELKCGLTVHPGRHKGSPAEILRMLREEGADLTRVIIGHIERTIQNVREIRALVELGCFVEYDLFGLNETTRLYRELGIDMPNDADRLNQIAQLVEAGYASQILVSHDIGSKHRLRRYGGIGYDHILRSIVPWMKQRGIEDQIIAQILVSNPARALAMPASPHPH